MKPMKFRKMGNSGWQASVLGFGCMRLPTTDNRPMSPNIDESLAIRMIRAAIDGGVNYFDTAYPYHSGQSEVVLGKALKDGFRRRVKIATKLPVWFVEKPQDFDRLLDEQLKRLQDEHIDFYLLHALEDDKWKNTVLKHKLIEKAEIAIRDGRIGALGFSFHDRYDSFPQIVDGYDRWALCQIQYNYIDTENQAGTKGMRYAASRGIPVVAMEPIFGGRLANPPPPVKKILNQVSHRKWSPAEWALHWIWDQPEITLLLSGMSQMCQVEENLAAAGEARERQFTSQDHAIIARIVEKYKERRVIPCTKCSYCMPCPSGVDIPRNFELYNDGVAHENMGIVRGVYLRFMGEEDRASACTACRACEEKCPQKIEISEWMVKVAEALK